jgi:hypothetical protein
MIKFNIKKRFGEEDEESRKRRKEEEKKKKEFLEFEKKRKEMVSDIKQKEDWFSEYDKHLRTNLFHGSQMPLDKLVEIMDYNMGLVKREGFTPHPPGFEYDYNVFNLMKMLFFNTFFPKFRILYKKVDAEKYKFFDPAKHLLAQESAGSVVVFANPQTNKSELYRPVYDFAEDSKNLITYEKFDKRFLRIHHPHYNDEKNMLFSFSKFSEFIRSVFIDTINLGIKNYMPEIVPYKMGFISEEYLVGKINDIRKTQKNARRRGAVYVLNMSNNNRTDLSHFVKFERLRVVGFISYTHIFYKKPNNKAKKFQWQKPPKIEWRFWKSPKKLAGIPRGEASGVAFVFLLRVQKKKSKKRKRRDSVKRETKRRKVDHYITIGSKKKDELWGTIY